MDASRAATTDWAMALANSGDGACWDAAVWAASVTVWASWFTEVSCVSMPTSDVGLLLRDLPLPTPDIFHLPSPPISPWTSSFSTDAKVQAQGPALGKTSLGPALDKTSLGVV